MIKAILFDRAGVLLTYKGDQVFGCLAEGLGIDSPPLLDLRALHTPELARGKMTPQAFARSIKETFHLPHTVSDILARWREAYRTVVTVNRETVALAKRLRERYRVGILTNVNALHAEIDRRRGLFEPFDPVIISSQVGFAKPQREIYMLALARLGREPHECVLIDDREDNLEIPKAMGFHVIQFENGAQLPEALQRLGVEIPSEIRYAPH